MACQKRSYKPGEVLKLLESSEFDNLSVPELDDSSSDDDEPMLSDVIVDNQHNINLCDLIQSASSEAAFPQPEACFRSSVLLDDVEICDCDDDDDNNDENNIVAEKCSSDIQGSSKSQQRLDRPKTTKQQLVTPKAKSITSEKCAIDQD